VNDSAPKSARAVAPGEMILVAGANAASTSSKSNSGAARF